MTTPLTLYPVNSASSVLTNAALLLSASGSTTTGAPTTLVGTSINWGEIAFNGNTGPWAAAGAEPNPTGYGALFDASSSVLVAQMLLAGNWSGVLKLFTNGTGTTLSLDHLKLRFWKWTSGTAISSATAIGSIDLGVQTLNTTSTAFTWPSTSESLMAFSPSGNDYLYIDCVSHITGSTNTTSTTKIKMTLGGASTTQGNANFNIVSPGYQPTPVLAVASSTLSFSATAGGANPANQTDNLSETAGTGTTWTSSIVYGSGSGWLAISPTTDTLAASGNENITFTCTTGALAAGTYSATVTLTASTGGNTVTVTVTFTVNPSGVIVYADSPYGMTRYVSGNKTALTYDSLQLFASFTNGGTIPFYIRYQYSWKYIETSKNTYGGWGPLDETVDKVMGTPGLRLILNLAYAPSWWLAIDANGNNVGYGGNGAVLPDGPAAATFAAAVTTRYQSYINSGRIILQEGNEEYDSGLAGSIGGKILAQTFNYIYPAITSIAPNAIVIAGAIRPLSHPNGQGTQQWLNNFYGYVPKAGEPAQALPYAHDFHLYDDSSNITATKYPSPDPTVTDNSTNPLLATKPSVQGIVSIMQGVISQYNPNCQIWNLENGYSLPNASPLNHNNAPSDLPSQQDRYTLDVMAQLQYAQVGGKYAFYSALTSGNDPRALAGTSMTDFTSAMAATPQWTAGASGLAQYLPVSVSALSFEGTPSQKPPDQYFSIMNATSTGGVAWSLSSNQSWLTAKTVPTNGIGGNQGGGLTSGTLAAGQNISLMCTADSTVSGLTTLTTLTGTLTITIGANNYTITVSLFVVPNAANPNITSTNAEPNSGLTFSMAVNAAPPVSQGFSFTNQDAFSTWWYAFTTANWFTLDTSSGNLAAGANQTINVTIGSIASSFAPGTYTEVVTVAATPFPAPYTWNSLQQGQPTQFITIQIKLTVTKSSTSAVQVSASNLYYFAVASGSLPASQTFYLHNCRNATDNWTVAKTQTWLTLSPTSGSNLPANGSNNGASGGPQATDYAVVTASINTTGLAAGTYSDTITVTLGTATATINVTYYVSSSGSTQTIGASPSSLSLTQVQGGADVSGNVTLTNSGTASGTWTHANAYTVGNGWITRVTPGTGTITGGGGQQVVSITVHTGTRAPGTYTGTVTFTLGSSTAVVNVTFTITAGASGATFAASPSALAFSVVVNGTDPAGQTLTISNTGGSSGTWSASIAYNNLGNNQGWLTLSPLSGALGAGANQTVSAFADDTNLLVGTYTATITIVGPNNTVTVTVTFVVSAQLPGTSGALSNLLSLAIQKTQIVKIYDQFGNFINVWRDAPYLTGLKQTMNAADSQIKMVLPRTIDAFGGAGQPNTDNSIVMGNNVQIWLYGPGLPTSGLLKFNGVIDNIEPDLSSSNAEKVTVTLTPYGSIFADHGYPGSLTLTNVDPLQLFTYWFNNTQPTTGQMATLGGVTFADPLTLSPASATSSGESVSYTILNQNIKSVTDAMLLMLGAGWFWRANPDKSALIAQQSPVAQHVLLLGQHMASMSYSSDNNQRKNVIQFVGSTGISATAVGASAKPVSQGGIGERMAFYQDSRIKDNGTAQVVANGLLSYLDQPLVRTKCRLADFRGDTKTALGYDIESIYVGDTISIRDARQQGTPSTYGSARYGTSRYGASPGVAFNTIVPVLSIDYQWNFIDIECGTFQPSQDRQLFKIRQALQDFTVGQA